MAVQAIVPEYTGEIRDRLENFHGNQLVYIGWDKHMMFCAPFAFPLPADMPFAALKSEVMPGAFGQHPQWDDVNWDKATWLKDGEAFVPDDSKGLAEQGIGHKTVLRFQTPGQRGFMDADV